MKGIVIPRLLHLVNLLLLALGKSAICWINAPKGKAKAHLISFERDTYASCSAILFTGIWLHSLDKALILPNKQKLPEA